MIRKFLKILVKKKDNEKSENVSKHTEQNYITSIFDEPSSSSSYLLNKNLNFQKTIETVTDDQKFYRFKLEDLNWLDISDDCENSPSEEEDNCIEINEKWEQHIGENVPIITPNDFVKIEEILEKPKLKDGEINKHELQQVLPYIFQRLKMWGVRELLPEYLSQLNPTAKIGKGVQSFKLNFIAKDKTSLSCNDRVSESMALAIRKPSINRLDIIIALFNFCHPLVAIEVAKILSQFPVALPLIIPCISKDEKGKFAILLTYLQSSIFKWESTPGNVIENQLFVSPYKLIAAVRIGENRAGKSAILNELLFNKTTFSSFCEPGALQGKPVGLLGSVEITALTKETCGNGLWQSFVKDHYASNCPAILLLANLHGDAIELESHIDILKKLEASFLVFVMPEKDSKTLQDKVQKVESIINCPDKIVYVLVDNQCEELSNPDIEINSNQRNDGITHEKMWRVLIEGYNSANIVHQLPVVKTENIKLRFVSPLQREESRSLIEFVKTTGCQAVRNILLLQKEKKINEHQLGKIYMKSKDLQAVMQMFCKIMLLPRKDRQIALHHLDQEISVMTKAETAVAYGELLSLKTQLRKNLGMDLESQKNIEDLQKKINLTLFEIDSMSLGMEHFFRETGRYFELSRLSRHKTLLSLPKRYAELLLLGHAIELLDGDIGSITDSWISAICHEVCNIKPKLKIFVISILGLQSSGKSTLLNVLFACKFAVSVGRCTRGLYMRLLMLEDGLKDKLKCDAFLLIDTEGLGAPEKMNDPESEKKDRQMATFAMSVSNLTLINAIGESVRDLTEILQIVIVTLARLEQADISPDILLVQHLSERNQSKSTAGVEEFCAALRSAIETTVKKDMALGVQNSKSLKTLMDRVQRDEVRLVFRPFKQGASANASPSEEYHEDVVELYNKIIELSEGKVKEDFHKWYYRLNDYFNAVSSQNFSLRFKNIKDMQDFIEIGQEIAKAKELLDAAFKQHRQKLETDIRGKKRKDSGDYQFSHDQDMRTVSKTCNCKWCKNAIEQMNKLFETVKGNPFEKETKETVESYWNSGFKASSQMIQQFSKNAIATADVKDSINALITETLQDHLNKHGQPSDARNCNAKVKSIWEKVVLQVKGNIAEIPYPIKSISLDVHETYSQYTTDTDCKEVKNLQGIQGKELSTNGNAIFTKPIKMSHQHIRFVESELTKLCDNFISDSKANHYDKGMMFQVKTLVNELIPNIEKQLSAKLEDHSKLRCHLYAISYFITRMEKMQEAWEKKNDPLVILNNDKENYMKQIEIRLQDGFTMAGEGVIIGQLLASAIQDRAEMRGTAGWKDITLGLIWMRSSSNIRLKYFHKLANDVKKGIKSDALQFFKNPNECIRNWLVQEVDKTPRSEPEGFAHDTYQNEFKNVIQDVRNKNSYKEIIHFVQEYISVSDNIHYNGSLAKDNPSDEEFQCFRNKLEDYLKQTMGQPKTLQLNSPSTQQEVLNRLGCTHHCFWCGSLCWGETGHEKNIGETRKHHSCHQPRGLHGTRYHELNNLIPIAAIL